MCEIPRFCKMCGHSDKPLIRCHVYPHSMTKESAGQPRVLISMGLHDGKPLASYSNGGIYDEGMVCGACEALFKAADDYAIHFRRAVLNLGLPFSLPWKTSRLPVFRAAPAPLHTFAMQTWLRSHMSSRYEHAQVNDVEIATEVKSCLLGRAETISTGRDVAYVFFTGQLGGVIATPMHHHEGEFPLYEMWLPNMFIYIAASKSGLPPGFRDVRLRNADEVAVMRLRRPSDGVIRRIADVYVANLERSERMFRRY